MHLVFLERAAAWKYKIVVGPSSYLTKYPAFARGVLNFLQSCRRRHAQALSTEFLLILSRIQLTRATAGPALPSALSTALPNLELCEAEAATRPIN